MSNKRDDGDSGFQGGLGFKGLLGGFGDILEKLGELAEKGESLSKTVEFENREKEMKGVYGFSVKMGLGKDSDSVKVEPFGNIGRDEATGESVVREVREPMTDLFQEPDGLLIVAELPGVSESDVKLSVSDDLLLLHAERGEIKYSKEILMPETCPVERMDISCNNGILRIKCRGNHGEGD